MSINCFTILNSSESDLIETNKLFGHFPLYLYGFHIEFIKALVYSKERLLEELSVDISFIVSDLHKIPENLIPNALALICRKPDLKKLLIESNMFSTKFSIELQNIIYLKKFRLKHEINSILDLTDNHFNGLSNVTLLSLEIVN